MKIYSVLLAASNWSIWLIYARPFLRFHSWKCYRGIFQHPLKYRVITDKGNYNVGESSCPATASFEMKDI